MFYTNTFDKAMGYTERALFDFFCNAYNGGGMMRRVMVVWVGRGVCLNRGLVKFKLFLLKSVAKQWYPVSIE